MHARRQGTDDPGPARQAGTVHERAAVLPLHQPRCTPKGEIYVSDGYGNAQVHKFSPDRKIPVILGQVRHRRGEFNLPHNIHCDADGWVYVADRENHRVQVFDGNGKFETAWSNVVHRPSAMHMTTGTCPLCFIGEIGPYLGSNRGFPTSARASAS